jgi:hypothetical protein
MSAALPIPWAHFAQVPGAEALHLVPASRYDSTPPALHGFRPADGGQAREFLSVIARPEVPCRPEALLLFRDALVLDGSYVVSRDGVAVRESYYNVPVDTALAERQAWQLSRIAAGDVATLPSAGPPVVALFLQDCNNFGHILAEMLPRLLHLEAAGIREIRLLLPQAAEPFRPVIGFALQALGMRAELVTCPAGSILRVGALHWPSLVGEGWFKSPTVRRLFARLRDAAPEAGMAEKVFVARPSTGRRVVTNADAAAQIAADAGYLVVEPSALPFAEQVALFAGARRVVGAFGAALTLTGFMAPGGRVGTIGPGYCDYFYWDLACLAGLGFDWGFAAPVERFRRGMLDEAITLPLGMLRRILKEESSFF